jgi:hypothetical protein
MSRLVFYLLRGDQFASKHTQDNGTAAESEYVEKGLEQLERCCAESHIHGIYGSDVKLIDWGGSRVRRMDEVAPIDLGTGASS